jgi:hypothetical protein
LISRLCFFEREKNDFLRRDQKKKNQNIYKFTNIKKASWKGAAHYGGGPEAEYTSKAEVLL